ncbi:hypothetical protein LGN04_29590, partial [Burkholderia multivorans]|nr:hypothetical protein [Burkholderia multivorans]MDN7873609.1 hypothetical protein [Burkholderia multivorans]
CPKFVINDWLTHLLGPSVTMAKVNRMLKKLTALGLFLKPSLSLPTVKWHLRNLYGKLGVRNRSAALAKARAYGLLT